MLIIHCKMFEFCRVRGPVIQHIPGAGVTIGSCLYHPMRIGAQGMGTRNHQYAGHCYCRNKVGCLSLRRLQYSGSTDDPVAGSLVKLQEGKISDLSQLLTPINRNSHMQNYQPNSRRGCCLVSVKVHFSANYPGKVHYVPVPKNSRAVTSVHILLLPLKDTG